MDKFESASGTTKVILINLGLILVVGIVFEIGYRLSNPNATFYSRTYPGQMQDSAANWARPDPDLGWVAKGVGPTTFENSVMSKRSWSATLNAQGFRNPVDFDDIGPKEPDVTRIMVLGDSFAFGPYLQDSETLASNILNKLGRGHEIYDISVPGWGVDQMYLAYQKYVDLIAPDIVILAYIDDDLLRVYEAFRRREKLSKPSFVLADGKLVPRTNERREWLDWIAQSSQFLNDYYAGSIRYKRCEKIGEAIFAELAADTRREGRQLIVLRYPTTGEFRRKEKRRPFGFDKFLAERSVTHIDSFDNVSVTLGESWSKFFLDFDGHPAGLGNALIADLLIAELRN